MNAAAGMENPVSTAHSSARIDFLLQRWGEKVLRRSALDHSMPEGAKAFDLLIDADPTRNKEFLDWLCRAYANATFLIEDCERVKNTLILFHRWKHRLPEKMRDVLRHKDEQSLWDCVERFDPTRQSDEDESAEGKELRRRERARALAESDILDPEGLEGWVVASPSTWFASKWWGRGTRWCTAMNAVDHHFDFYHRKGPLRVFVSPQGKKFQVHVASLGCTDASDKPLNLAEFLTALPLPAVELLRKDARTLALSQLNGKDLARVVTGLPEALLDEDLVAGFRKLGEQRIHVLASADEGWRLLHVSDPLSKWALKLRDDYGFSHLYNWLVFETPDGENISMNLENTRSSKHMRRIGEILRSAPKELADAVAVQLVELWEGRKGYRHSAHLSAFIAAFGPENMPAKAWRALAVKLAKKPRDWYEIAIPHEYVDDEVADALSIGWSLMPIPAPLRTRERILRFAAARPTAAVEEIPTLGAGLTIDREVALAMASYGDGRGFEHVPAEMKTPEFCREILSLYPNALKHIPDDILTDEEYLDATRRCGRMAMFVPKQRLTREMYRAAVAQNGDMIMIVPEEYRDAELCEVALKSCPEMFPHARHEIRYEDYLRGVSVSGSLLARVPLTFRDLDMCRAAVMKQTDALAHVPPKVAKMLRVELPELLGNASVKLSSRYLKGDPIFNFEPPQTRPERLPCPQQVQLVPVTKAFE